MSFKINISGLHHLSHDSVCRYGWLAQFWAPWGLIDNWNLLVLPIWTHHACLVHSGSISSSASDAILLYRSNQHTPTPSSLNQKAFWRLRWGHKMDVMVLSRHKFARRMSDHEHGQATRFWTAVPSRYVASLSKWSWPFMRHLQLSLTSS